MKILEYFIVLLLVGFALCFSVAVVQAEGKFKLQEGAKGKLCLGCHSTFGSKMKAKHIHTPLAQGECTGCHNPHASDHGMLMDGSADSICYNCHVNVVPAGAASSHQVAAEGKCVSCHDPHSSDYPANLIKGGSKLCFECHKELGDKIASSKFGHAPVQQDCLKCHNPHASEKNASLLKTNEPGLCLECHQTSSSGFKKQHMNYPVEQGRCTSCHDPHGSNNPKMLTAKGPFLCTNCHQYGGHVNVPRYNRASALIGQGCVNCHSRIHGSNHPSGAKLTR